MFVGGMNCHTYNAYPHPWVWLALDVKIRSSHTGLSSSMGLSLPIHPFLGLLAVLSPEVSPPAQIRPLAFLSSPTFAGKAQSVLWASATICTSPLDPPST